MPSAALNHLLPRVHNRYLLLDSNLLLLWVTAQYDPRLLRTFKRVQMFTQDDAILLAWVVDRFKAIVTTSHVVTEVANLANSLTSRSRVGWFTALAEFSQISIEHTEPLNSLAQREEFVRFGVTDCALSHLAGSYQVLTTDYRLSSYANAAGTAILNFDDLRSMI